MRRIKKAAKAGFTLVELMIVVAIIGVLAALAIYGVSKYLASAKTSEAKNSVGAIARGAAAAYERETAASQLLALGGTSSAASHSLCTGAAATVPADLASVKGVKYQPDPTEGKDYQIGTATGGWKCIRFEMSQPQYYLYGYKTSAASPVTGEPAFTAEKGFSAYAQGDLDGDGVASGFSRVGSIDTTTQALIMATQLTIANEFE